MGQILKRKKKGRPSKADLASRNSTSQAPPPPPPERDLRRSLRRRNVRYTFDFDDYLDDDEYYDDEEDERRREKKLNLLLKESSGTEPAQTPPTRGNRHAPHAPPTSSASSSDDDGSKPLKKRKIDGDDEITAGIDGDEEDEDNEVEEEEDEDNEVTGRREEARRPESIPGTPPEPAPGFPLPDKRNLELILDKLQKKDIYGVYAEPVDPEELPDYHDVIDQPMDFGTVRNKLANGAYTTFELFESDVFLICSNAMQYNAPDTIYYKQARSIQELAKKKFQKLRIDMEDTEKEMKSDQKLRSTPVAKNHIKRPVSQRIQEPLGSDFSSRATLATTGDFQHGLNVAQASLNVAQASGSERPSSVDLHVEGNSSFVDNNLDKAEELQPGRGLLSRFGRKPSMHEENRRATYSVSCQPVPGPESIFKTFEGESKHLVTVGLHAEHSYARSLARFAATLGPIAWKVASRRIEQALPPGCKFGHGWVGEYEPLSTPVLMLEKCTLKEPAFFAKSELISVANKDEKMSKVPISAKEHPSGPTSEGKLMLFGTGGTKPHAAPTGVPFSAKDHHPIRGASLEVKPSSFSPHGSTNASNQQQSPQSRNSIEPEKKVLKQEELNCPPLANQRRQISNGPEVPVSTSVETVIRNKNLRQSASLKKPNINGTVAGGLPNGKVGSSRLEGNSFPNQAFRAGTHIPQGQEQGLSDSVQLMKNLAERAQNKHKSSNASSVGNSPVISHCQSLKRDDSNNAAAAAARAWMSIGAGGFKPAAENVNAHKSQITADSLYNPARDLHPQVTRFRGEFPASGIHFQPDKNNFPLHAFVPQHISIGSEAQLQARPMVFPQLVAADLSSFQVQSPWRGINPQVQPRQTQESLPPDLNIGFQSSGSPVRQSSSVLVDSQQPDLALQL